MRFWSRQFPLSFRICRQNKQQKGFPGSLPAAQCVVLELEKLHIDQSLPAREQLKQFRSLYVQGVISEAAFDLKKRLLSE